MAQPRDREEIEKDLIKLLFGDGDAIDFLGPEGLGRDDYRLAWDMHCGSVTEASIKEFVGEGQRCHFDFAQIRPRLDLYQPEWKEFHKVHIQPIVELIKPLPEGTLDNTTPIQRLEATAPLIRNVLSALYDLPQLEFMREEIEGDYDTLLEWFSGKAHGLSWTESFFGKRIPLPESCATMARRA